MLSKEPVERSSMQKTSSPRETYKSVRCDPMKPAPPVIKTRKLSYPLSSSPPARRRSAGGGTLSDATLRVSLGPRRLPPGRRAPRLVAGSACAGSGQLLVEAEHVRDQTL